MFVPTISWLAALTVWPGAVGADVHDGLADRVEDRLGGREVLGRAADHDRQRSVLGAGLAAGDGRVEQPEAALARGLRQLGGDVRPDAGEVDHERARGGAVEHAVLAGEHLLDVGGVRHHDRDDVGVLAPRRRSRTPCGRPPRRAGRAVSRRLL